MTKDLVTKFELHYYNAIESSTAKGESTPFIEFMLEIILKSMQNTLQSDQKSNYKSDQKILSLIKENSTITIRELMEILSMSESGVKKVIKKLKDEGTLHRIGSLKSGHWEVLPKMEYND